MSYSRHITIIALLCAVFVSGAALLRASGMAAAGGRFTADVADAVGDFAHDQRLAIEEAFFSSTTAPATEVASEALPKPAKPASVPVARPPADAVTADAYLVGDVRTGEIYIEKNALATLSFASMSKIITAVAATDTYDSELRVTISTSSTEVAPDASNLRAGETFTVKELLYPMLMNSSNVAAEALASAAGDRAKFLESMSGYAWEIGMPKAFFADPTGLSSRNAGTARGFFAMAQYLYARRPDILEITRIQKMSIATTTDHGSHELTNIHPFVMDPRFLGGKTGRTPEALETMLTILNIKDHPVAIIVLRSDGARAGDTSILIDRVEKILR